MYFFVSGTILVATFGLWCYIHSLAMNDLIPEESSEEVVVENRTVLLIGDALASFKVWVRDLISIWPVWFQTLINYSQSTIGFIE